METRDIKVQQNRIDTLQKRIIKLEVWVTEHEKVKSKHEMYMVTTAIVAALGVILAVVLGI